MNRAPLQHVCDRRRRLEATGPIGIVVRPGFSLVELLVVTSIMAIMVGLVGAAVSGARVNAKKQQTQLLISKLDMILQQQMTSYASRTAPPNATTAGFPGAAAFRSWHIRRNLITGDLPDRWSDVAALASGALAYSTTSGGTTTQVPLPITQPQRTYAAVLLGLARQKNGGTAPSAADVDATANALAATYAGAECLFMIVMQGGIANCIDCGELKTADRGDKDGDGMFEFWDAWGNPIGFILWPAGLQLPAGTGTPFFSGSRSLEQVPLQRGITSSPALGMRPLIYSAGPDGEYGFNRASEAATLTAGAGPVGRDCGNPLAAPTQTMAAPDAAAAGFTRDNITNLDAEATR